MTIRPVDLQIVIPRVTEVGKIQHTTDHQETLQQQQFGEKWQKISDKREHQVQGTNKSEASNVSEKKYKEQKHSKEGKNHADDKSIKDEADKGNHPSNKDPMRGNLIDIKT